MLTRQGKIELVERALRSRIQRDPRTELVVAEGWVQTITRGMRSELYNRVYFSVLDAAEADARIASTLATYRMLGLPMMWMVSPGSRPLDLAARLRAAGLELAGAATGMIAEVSKLRLAPIVTLTVEPVDEANLEEWLHVQAVGWGASPDVIRHMREAARWLRGRGNDRIVDLVCRIDGAVCGACSLEIHDDFGLLANGAVLPEHRGRGLFRAMVAARMDILRARGVPYAVMHAMKHSAGPMALRFGFEAVCELSGYRRI